MKDVNQSGELPEAPAFSPEKVRELKNKHGQIYQIDIEPEDGMTVHYLAKLPNRKVMKAVVHFSESDPLRSNEVLIENCVVAGDTKLIENDQRIFFALGEQLGELMKVKRASIKKL